MRVLKGKNKIIFFLFLFFSLTTYEFHQENSFPLFKIKHVQFNNNNYLEENIKYKIINNLEKQSLLSINYKAISSLLKESQWVENFMKHLITVGEFIFLNINLRY